MKLLHTAGHCGCGHPAGESPRLQTSIDKEYAHHVDKVHEAHIRKGINRHPAAEHKIITQTSKNPLGKASASSMGADDGSGHRHVQQKHNKCTRTSCEITYVGCAGDPPKNKT